MSDEQPSNRTVVSPSTPPEAASPRRSTGEYGAYAPTPRNLVGTVLLDRYKIIGHLGDGGMGSVYLVEHTTILKKFAAKILSPALSTRQDFIDRFLREARAASQIDHPNVVEITDFGRTPSGEPFFVMEYLQGEDLSETVETAGAIPWERVKPMILQISGALAAAHVQGIVHRDMKPGNCLRVRSGNNPDFVKVLDFGIAKVQSMESEGRSLTQTGTVIGTPEYMSPEQGWGHAVDHRADIYAVGVILYELLTGHVPFSGETMMEVLNRHIYEVPNLDHPHISPEIGAVILKAMQKDRELRFQSMDAMIAAIEAVGTGAAQVEVVDEEIKAPWGPVTARYTTAVSKITASGDPHDTAEGPLSSAPGLPQTAAAPAKGRSYMTYGIALACAVGLAFLGAYLLGLDLPEEDTPPAVAAADEPEGPVAEPEPPPPPTPAVIQPGAKTVMLKIATPGIDAQILDARDEAIYGHSNAPEGVKVRQSDQPLRLLLRAEGYEDLEFAVVPDVDGKNFEKTLARAKSTKKKQTASGTKRPPADPKGTPSKDPEEKEPAAKEPATKESEKKDGSSDFGEIKNPFN